MELVLEIISNHKYSDEIKVSHTFRSVGGYIGRSDECDWVIADKTRFISRKHALIVFDQNSFYLEDMSSNGIIDLKTSSAVGKDVRHKLEHGDVLVLGEFHIQVRMLHNPQAYTSAPLENPEQILPDEAYLTLDPIAALDQEERATSRERLGILHPEAGDDFDQVPNHTQSWTDSMRTVSAIPEDWFTQQPLVTEEKTVQEEEKAEPEPTEEPQEETEATSPQERLPNLDSFFKGLGMAPPALSVKEQEELLSHAGTLLRAGIEGILEMLQLRAECKNEYRIPMTTVKLAGNNPFKYSPHFLVALEHLLLNPPPNTLAAPQAIRAAMRDLHQHNTALMAGARAATRGVLKKISPEVIEAEAQKRKGIYLSKEKAKWHAFLQGYNSMLEDENFFNSLFFQDFAEAYTEQIALLQSIPISEEE